MGDPGPSGRFGQFGGRFVPESLVPACLELEAAFRAAWADPAFRAELDGLLGHYGGRPTPVTECGRLSAELGVRLLLKREDLAHTGSHKINNVIGQGLLARRMGKTRLIAETGAGQHGVATATAAALFGMDCVVYMGEVDTHRQELNVFRMELLGAEVRPVYSGSRTLKDAVNEALRDWVATVGDTHYCVGSVMGPHPYPVDGPRVPAGDRRGGPGAVPCAARRRATPMWWWPAPAAAPTPPASSPGSPTPPTPALVAVEAAGGAAMTTGIPGVLHGMRSAAHAGRGRARSSRPTPSRPGSTTRASAPSTPIWASWDGPATSRPTTTRCSTPSNGWPAPRGSSPPSSRPTPWPG